MSIINQITILAVNSILVITNLPEYLMFLIVARNPEGAQEKYRKIFIKNNIGSKFGKEYNFSNILSYSDFKKLPFTEYQSYLKYIDQIKKGENNILTTDKVIVLEPTSGSTSASKLIPYTHSLKREFNRGISSWIIDMYLNHPILLYRQSYWSITPNSQIKETISSENENIINVGFEDDSEYLGKLGKYLMGHLLVMPNEVAKISNSDAFYYVTLIFLIKSRNLGFISVWSPTMISLILKKMLPLLDSLLSDLEAGKINVKYDIDADIRLRLEKKLGRNPKRAIELRDILRHSSEESLMYEKIWPKLVLISAWADSHSAFHVNDIRKYFPSVKIVGKGLIATEYFASFPMERINSCVLSIRSHFFEFLNIKEDNGAKIYLAHQLKMGEKYSIIVSNGAGLCRYKTGDNIEVVGIYKRTPLIRFIGRQNCISDLFGEKLNENYVALTLKNIFLEFEINPIFYLLSIDNESVNNCFRYVLFIEGVSDDFSFSSLAKQIDNKLRENFHYNHCREIGQLSNIAIYQISGGGLESYINRYENEGQKIGNIKIMTLSSQSEWAKYFKGKYII